MARRSFGPERIINKLREAEVLLGQGSTVAEVRVLIEQWRRGYDIMSSRAIMRCTTGHLHLRLFWCRD
jgi:signal recognition particle GTPase